MKAHHPLEFAAATLTHTDDPKRQLQILRELHSEGVSYIPVDADLSTDKWQVGRVKRKKALIGPVQNVHGIGPKLVSQIVSARVRSEPIPERAKKLLSNPRTPLDSLWPIQTAFERIMPDPTERNIHTSPTPIGSIQANGSDQSVVVFCVAEAIRPRDQNDLQMVAKRGYELKGPTMALNLTLADDSGTIFAKVGRYDYRSLGQPIIDRGRPGKAMYAIAGVVPRDFRMISVKKVRYIGDIVEGDADDEEGTSAFAHASSTETEAEATKETEDEE